MAMAFKRLLQTVSLALAVPMAALSFFGRFPTLYTIGAHSFAQIPGVPGDYLRIAFYRLTLRKCSRNSRISFGSFFAQPGASVAPAVYIGSYCVLGRANIGARTQIASGVQILSGSHQHGRDAAGNIKGAEADRFTEVSIGEDCWIGAAAIVMADVGSGSTVGAGAIVTKPVPPGVVVAGNPARIIKAAAAD
jgi:virginiamycin A acetyltransferase